MNPSDLRLQRKLLAWLLSPLLALLVLDAAVTWWSSRHLSNLAYDRSLQEIAREIVLDVNPGAGGPQLELTQAAERILLIDPDDRLFFRVTAEDGREVPLMKLESTSETHPFYTGTQKSIDNLGGRVDKFRTKFAHLGKKK